MQGGLIALGVGLVGSLAFILTGVSRWWRGLLFLPFWQGALGVFQALDAT